MISSLAQTRPIALGCFRSSGPITPHGDLETSPPTASVLRLRTADLVAAHHPASLLADIDVPHPQAGIPSRRRRHPCRRGRRPAALAASTGTVAEGPPKRRHGAQIARRCSTPTVLLVRRGPWARQCGTPVRGLTLARRAS